MSEKENTFTAAQEAYAVRIRAELERRLSALLASSPRVKYTAEGREAIRRGALEAIREVEPAADLLDVSTPEERSRGLILLRKVTPPAIGKLTILGAVGPVGPPPCHPSMPCGCYGCATCNGAQAPMYPTPAFGVPAAADPSVHKTFTLAPCTCGSATCNRCRAQRGMGPAGVKPRPGSAKPNGGGSQATRAANAERGYRVLPYGDWLNAEQGTREGQTFSTPDLATQRARRGAKEGKETFLVLRDGTRWKLLKADGDEVVIG